MNSILGIKTKLELAGDYLSTAEAAAEVSIICARSSNSVILFETLRESYPEGYAERVALKNQLLEFARWFQKDSKEWRQAAQEYL